MSKLWKAHAAVRGLRSASGTHLFRRAKELGYELKKLDLRSETFTQDGVTVTSERGIVEG